MTSGFKIPFPLPLPFLLDETPQMEEKITNKRPTHSEKCGVCSRIIKKYLVHYTTQTIGILSQRKARHWNFCFT